MSGPSSFLTITALCFRGGAVAVESSGLPTVLNNQRSLTPDRMSNLSNGRRVRVSTNTHPHTPVDESRSGENKEPDTLGVYLCLKAA